MLSITFVNFGLVGLEVLIPQGRMFPKETQLSLVFDHFGVLISPSHQKEKDLTLTFVGTEAKNASPVALC